MVKFTVRRIVYLYCCVSIFIILWLLNYHVIDEGEDGIVEEKLEVLQKRLAEKEKLLDESRRRVREYEDKLHKCRMLKPFQKPFNTSLPTIYLITPTYDRIEQKAELTRLYYTLLHVPNIHWIIVEDSDKKTDKVRHFLAKCQIPYTHLNVATPQQVKLKSSDPNWLKPRGVLQRNAGLTWIRASLDPQKTKGVVYFADDDNTYSIELFEEMRFTKKVSVWPVAMVGGLRFESPICDKNLVTGWGVYYRPTRPFPIDMAGFAVNLQLFFDHPNAWFSNNVQRGYQESTILRLLDITMPDLEPRADRCTKILVWHTRTEKYNPKNEAKLKQKTGKGTDPNTEI
ncbi:galactosylgalactosylxylosylprotein 3-beta-glucuronosyltransferase 3-like [Ostrea edulis]|uniref:galactosylgalactosylxylosylprotein 3-beta-glucuronosyltransferase 3-like n=1 Tax=Ostrea edulis TaxID=37623 RepID=UPI0024AEADB9|nr:galactosylgalactosylxylosylprotein 3-beta-glucuronosyltransferase 3-like [Ostrea edulis]XP_048731934.2 galactosylgalactosylxylosylprotein 3-beta-glucuronosyltransferase 3-like [Ostrea edulis]XP_048731935.2 galactosylgalactosylxylosylprotein 3-beta-glucuronosyltransferase 3-like [Ostrea edulis]